MPPPKKLIVRIIPRWAIPYSSSRDVSVVAQTLCQQLPSTRNTVTRARQWCSVLCVLLRDTVHSTRQIKPPKETSSSP